MAITRKVQDFLTRAEDFLTSAEIALERGLTAPAHTNAIHALELALKAAILKTGGTHDRTHDVGRPFGERYRDRLDRETLKRINRLLGKYNDARYPDRPAPEEDEVEEDVEFIRRFIREELPQYL